MDEAVGMVKKMYALFLEKDALLIEINPYAEDAITGKCELNQHNEIIKCILEKYYQDVYIVPRRPILIKCDKIKRVDFD